MSLTDRAARGERARQIIEDELWIDTHAKVRGAIIDQLGRVDLTAAEKQRALVTALQIADKVRGALEAVMQDGELAARQMDLIEDRKRRLQLKNPFRR